jgi:8-oxo-dGTP pyrophosphatase MutT (NUDIX family)
LVGNELLVLPSVAILPRDQSGRILLVRVIDTGQWATIGGAIEPDESPEDAAVRETEEEAGVRVSLGHILGVIGGPGFRITYPNGDQTSYITTVFDATVISGTPTPDHDETSAVQWWDPGELPYDQMSSFTRRLLRALHFAVPDDAPV